MKRYLSILLLLALICGLFAGCQEDPGKTVPPYTDPSFTETTKKSSTTQDPTQTEEPVQAKLSMEDVEAPGDREHYETTDARDGCIQLVATFLNFADEGSCCQMSGASGSLMLFDFDLGSYEYACPKANCLHKDESCPVWLSSWSSGISQSWYGVMGDSFYFAGQEIDEAGYSRLYFGQANLVTGEKTTYPVEITGSDLTLRNVFVNGETMVIVTDDEEKNQVQCIDTATGALSELLDFTHTHHYGFHNFWGLTPGGNLLYTSYHTVNGDPCYLPDYDGDYSSYLKRLNGCNFLYRNLAEDPETGYSPTISSGYGEDLIISSRKSNLGEDVYSVHCGALYVYDSAHGREDSRYRSDCVLTDWQIEDFWCLDGRVFFSTGDYQYYWYDPAGSICRFDPVSFTPCLETETHFIGTSHGAVCALEKQAFYQGDFSQLINLGSCSFGF